METGATPVLPELPQSPAQCCLADDSLDGDDDLAASRTPKAFCRPAQGCPHQRATLGKTPWRTSTLKGLQPLVGKS